MFPESIRVYDWAAGMSQHIRQNTVAILFGGKVFTAVGIFTAVESFHLFAEFLYLCGNSLFHIYMQVFAPLLKKT